MRPAQWSWQFSGPDGAAVRPPISPTFPSRFDAEAWLGESWRSLAAEGAAAATVLLEGTAQAAPIALVEPGDVG